MPTFVSTEWGELGMPWIWSALIYDTPVLIAVNVLLLPTSVELDFIHPWLIAPIFLALGPLYWIVLAALIRTLIHRLNQSGLDEIDRRIAKRDRTLP